MMKFGRSIHLSRADIDAGIRERALAIAKSRGLLPQATDALDFHGRVIVHYNIVPTAGPDGSTVPALSDVTLTWEEA